jgi:hypothetical protein
MLTAKDALLAGALSSSNPFVEDVSYTVSGGVAKTIRACVSRKAISANRDKIGSRSMYAAELIISNDETAGIPVVTQKKDMVSMAAPEIGKTAHDFLVVGIIGKTAMGWHLGLQQ